MHYLSASQEPFPALSYVVMNVGCVPALTNDAQFQSFTYSVLSNCAHSGGIATTRIPVSIFFFLSRDLPGWLLFVLRCCMFRVVQKKKRRMQKNHFSQKLQSLLYYRIQASSFISASAQRGTRRNVVF